MAGLTSYLSYFFCMDTVIVARINNKKQEKILWPYVYNDVYLECSNDLVDMERISTGRGRCFPG
jgi:hypothetical protein